ncbi:MAG: hypothetical protein OXM03_11055 [Chloroflexota bacterium]|nr:hypothetical protein [Chloroflexota bacterium]MDE2841154.1 hypothetical protein [Chloroflexota bacterium]MDE2930524.1 hypothetical protein [Chloroflexota bacterium]
MERLPHLSRRELLVSGAALGLAACGGPARGRDPLKSIQQGLAAAPLPPPWVPMVVRGTAIEVAGHRYRFDAGPFPTSLEVSGPEFLFDAINLDIRVQEELLVWQRARTVSVDATTVELLARGNAGDLIAQTRVTISYDGACRFRVSLIPQGIVTIDSILLDIPILRGETTHYAHHLLGAAALTYSSLEIGRLIEGRQSIWGGGRIPDNGWSGEITPLFWVGNPDRGLVWFTEQLADQQRQEPTIQIQLRPVEGAMRLLVDFITAPLDMPDTVHLDFGLQPTPVRPPESRRSAIKPARAEWWPEDSRMVTQFPMRATGDTRSTLESLRDQGTEAIILEDGWSDVPGFPHFASSEHEGAFHDLVSLTHDTGLMVIPTISADMLSFKAPGAAEVISDMPRPIQTNIINVSRAPADRVSAMFHTEATAAFFEQAVRAFAEKFSIDGVNVLIGEPTVRSLLRNERRAGAGAALDIQGRRELLRRLYALFHGGLRERDEDGIVIAHSPMPWSMIHSYADLLVTGLNVYRSILFRGLSDEALAKRWQPEQIPYLYGDVTHRVPTLFQVPTADTFFSLGAGGYEREGLTTDQELFGLAAVHNTSLWPEELTPFAPLADLARLEELRLSLGFGNASWHPYWIVQERLIVQPPSTLYGYWYRGSGSMLLLLLNGAGNDQDILVEVAGAASNGDGGLFAEEVWEGLPARTRDNLIITTLAPSQFAVLRIEAG